MTINKLLRGKFKRFCLFPLAPLLGFFKLPVLAAESLSLAGQLHYGFGYSRNPENSISRLLIGDYATQHQADSRLNINHLLGSWQGEIHYQFVTRQGDFLQNQALASSTFSPSDKQRLFNLQHSIHQEEYGLVSQRLDRFSIAKSFGQSFLKLGRQAISWGNGMLFNPVDFLNPFDPKLVTRDYKPGDDMLYSQYLFDNGSDVQGVWVQRRNTQGEATQSVATAAVKYHGFFREAEWDLLVAKHYDQALSALGLQLDIKGSLAKVDVMLVDTSEGTLTSAVFNLSRSWQSFGRNFHGFLEYFHNDAGLTPGNYRDFITNNNQPNSTANWVLQQQLQRGEVFTLGRDYLAVSTNVEVTPLWQFGPNIFYNMNDRSSLWQWVAQHSASQNINLFFVVAQTFGRRGSEFGGIESDVPAYLYRSGLSVSFDLFFYF